MAEFVQTKIRRILQLICLVFFTQHLYAQSNLWPEMFIAPDSSQAEPDDSYLNLSNEFSYYKELRNNFHLDYLKSRDNAILRQICEHSLLLYDDNTYQQYIDLTGSVEWGNLSFLNSDLGFDYEPKISYKRRLEGSILRSNLNAGPYLRVKPLKIPVKIEAGVTAASNDRLPGGLSSQPLKSYHADAGVYGGAEIGDTLRPIANLPLFVNLQLFGKTIEGAGSGLVMGNLLFQHQLQTGDSLYIYGADTLLNGKDIEFLYEETPWRINHSVQGAAGLKAKERRLGIVPAAFYSYRLSTTEYPSSENLIDIKKSSHTVNMQLATTDRYFFDYQGGLELTWDYEDHYFRDKSEVSDDLKGYNDHRSDLASSDHLLRINFPKNIAVEYELHAFKDSRKYSDSLNENETDYIRTRHHWGLRIDSVAGISSEIYGEYAKTYLYYFRKRNSQHSKIVDDYRAGLNVSFFRNRFRIDEKFFIDAEVTDYKFKYSTNLPPYSRRLSSTLNASWLMHKNVEIASSWIQKYNDRGHWYGRDYFDSTEVDFNSFYAIDSKTDDYAILFYTRFLFENWSANTGVTYRNIIQKNYDSRTDSYIKDNRKGYTIEPNMKFSIMLGFLNIQGKIGHIIFSRNNYLMQAGNKWDLYLKLDAAF
ncbi:MAG: hypothetical protein GX267_14910 [Fibrobacter sp.]|jgi:hypothetical protein|nr:hypothetical protein [Fibrobacter sp.]